MHIKLVYQPSLPPLSDDPESTASSFVVLWTTTTSPLISLHISMYPITTTQTYASVLGIMNMPSSGTKYLASTTGKYNTKLKVTVTANWT